jgi:hypothetical protein
MPQYVIFSKSGMFPPPVGRAELKILTEIHRSRILFTQKAVELLRKYTPVATGHLRRTAAAWGTRTYSLGGLVFYLGWRDQDFDEYNYSGFVESGTGIYGQYHTPIRPRVAKKLVWKHGDRWVSKETVRGQPGQFMMTQAVVEFMDWFMLWLERKRVEVYQRTV